MTSNPKKTLGTCAADGAWKRLESLEVVSQATISKQLSKFEAPFRDAYEAGVIVPVLRANGKANIDVRCAALFLKRVLNDLRCVWVLLIKGYSSQAASLAASLHENASATICLTLSKENIDHFLASPNGEIPWKPIQMAKMIIAGEGKKSGSKDFENGWRSLYAHYVWLCQIKHPTRDSVVHDTEASILVDKHYVVMAIPNIEEGDLAVKAMVAVISLHRTLEAIEAFARALGFGDELPDDYRFGERFRRARESAWQAFAPHQEANPISIRHSWFVEKYPPSPVIRCRAWIRGIARRRCWKTKKKCDIQWI